MGLSFILSFTLCKNLSLSRMAICFLASFPCLRVSRKMELKLTSLVVFLIFSRRKIVHFIFDNVVQLNKLIASRKLYPTKETFPFLSNKE